MDVSIIIVNYKTAELTIQSINSVKKFTEGVEYEIIVVDNASMDGSVEKIKSKYNDVLIISNSENLGFGRANNVGIEISKGEYVFLLNSDAFLTSNALFIFKQFMDEHPNAAVCGGNLITGRDDKTVSYGNLPSMLECISEIGFFILYRKYYRERIASGVVNVTSGIKKVGYVNGADMFVRKDVIKQVGAFDKDFFLYFEETELSFRIKNSGYECYILSEVDIIHLVGGSQVVKAFNYFNYKHYFRSKRLYFRKTSSLFYASIVYVLTIIQEFIFHITGRRRGNLMKKMAILIQN